MKNTFTKIMLCAGILGISMGATLNAVDAPAAYNKCRACHGADGKKLAPSSKVAIAGLPKEELLADLKGYKNGTTNKGGNAAIMYSQMKTVSDEDIEKLAEYISQLPK